LISSNQGISPILGASADVTIHLCAVCAVVGAVRFHKKMLPSGFVKIAIENGHL